MHNPKNSLLFPTLSGKRIRRPKLWLLGFFCLRSREVEAYIPTPNVCSGWRIHGSVEDTKLSTNKQHSLSVHSVALVHATCWIRDIPLSVVRKTSLFQLPAAQLSTFCLWNSVPPLSSERSPDGLLFRPGCQPADPPFPPPPFSAFLLPILLLLRFPFLPPLPSWWWGVGLALL
jgi:hypothetical protein